MKRTTRDRLVLPIVMPVGILVVIAALLYGFSRILLSISHNAATGVALISAMGIVVVGAVLASRTRVRMASLAGMVGIVAGVAMFAGGFALVAIGPEEKPAEGGEITTITLVAANLAFDRSSLTVPAGEPFRIVMDNQDAGVQHNVVINEKEDFTGATLFDGELVTGPAKVTYEVPALDAGTFYFHCVVHPTMAGTIEAVEGGGGPAEVTTVVAKGIAFDTATIELTANQATVIRLDNQDPGVQHNISIYEDDTLATQLFKGDLVTGPGSADYEIPSLPPGEYYFQCDVHPNMNGTVVVTEAGGGTGATGATGADGGGTVAAATVVAQGVAFDTAEIVLPAGQAVTITFDNQDAGVQHNIAIYADNSLATVLFTGELVTGVASVEYQIPALEAGTYYFQCDVHPNMNGTVTVE